VQSTQIVSNNTNMTEQVYILSIHIIYQGFHLDCKQTHFTFLKICHLLQIKFMDRMLIVTVLVYNRTDIHDEEHRLV